MAATETKPFADKAARRTAARWSFIAPTLFMLFLVNQLDKTNVAVIIADQRFLSDMGLAGQQVRLGFLSTIFFLGYGLGLLVWGFVVDRLGPRRSAMIGVCGWALTTMWCAMARGVDGLYAARFVLGLTEGCIWPVCNTYAARWFPARERGRIQSLWINGNQVGLALGLPIVTALISASGWRTVFWVLGAGSFFLLEPLLLFLAPDEPRGSAHANEAERNYILLDQNIRRKGVHTTRAAKLGTLLGQGSFWVVTLCHVGTVATLFGLSTWIPSYLTQVRRVPFSALGGWVGWSYLIPVPVAMMMGYFADRTLRPAMVGGVTAVMVALLVLGSVIVPSTIVSVLLLVTSLASPVIYGAMNTSIMQELAPPGQIGRATGIFVGVGNLVGGLAPTLIGYLIAAFSGRYLAAFGFISIVNVVMVILYFSIDRKPVLLSSEAD
jgi:MFS transporter, ACS family, glucarate transporter